MFDVGPSDLTMVIIFLIIAFIISIIVYFLFKKNVLLAVFTMSVLANIIFRLFNNSLDLAYRNLLWIVRFAYSYWPIINILLLVVIGGQLLRRYVKSKGQGD